MLPVTLCAKCTTKHAFIDISKIHLMGWLLQSSAQNASGIHSQELTNHHHKQTKWRLNVKNGTLAAAWITAFWSGQAHLDWFWNTLAETGKYAVNTALYSCIPMTILRWKSSSCWLKATFSRCCCSRETPLCLVTSCAGAHMFVHKYVTYTYTQWTYFPKQTIKGENINIIAHAKTSQLSAVCVRRGACT